MDFIRVLSRTPVVFILTALEKIVSLIHMNDIKGSCKLTPCLSNLLPELVSFLLFI